MGLFNRNQNAAGQVSQQAVLENAIKSSRNNILVIIGFTLLNIILLVTNSYTYFLFSAYVPYFLADYGMFFGGMYPPEYYQELMVEMEFLGKGFTATMLALAAIALVLYALCWWFSKQNPKGWLTFALVLFGIDTVMLVVIAGISADLILDYVFHGWIIVSLISGLSAVKKLKVLPDELLYAEDVPETELEEV